MVSSWRLANQFLVGDHWMGWEKLQINHGEHRAHRDEIIFSVISVCSVVKTDFFSSAGQGLQNLAHMVGVKLEMELSEAAEHAFQGRIFSQRRVFELRNTRLPVKLFPG